MEENQIIIKTGGMSGGMIRDLEKAIQLQLKKATEDIKYDIELAYPEKSKAKDQMLKWCAASYQEWRRFTRTYII